MLQQVEGRERTAAKLPSFAAIDDWWYPVRLSCEQCSSELTARYKARIVANGTCLDLTAGYGVDTFFLSAGFSHTDYVEQNAELCRIAAHNFSIAGRSSAISVHNTTAEDFLRSSSSRYSLIYLDPARRDAHGGKVFRLEDCTPDVLQLFPALLLHLEPGGHILLKLSPMLDITQAVKSLSSNPALGPSAWSVHVVAIKNEVKEVLLLSGGNAIITAIDLSDSEQVFTFSREEEQGAQSRMVNDLTDAKWLYEPNAAILKAGAYKLVGERFGLQKLDTNTHLYTSDCLVRDFPGRIWQISQSIRDKSSAKMLNGRTANILTRNYPLTPDQLKKQMRLKDGGNDYLIGARVMGKPTLFWAKRVENA